MICASLKLKLRDLKLDIGNGLEFRPVHLETMVGPMIVCVVYREPSLNLMIFLMWLETSEHPNNNHWKFQCQHIIWHRSRTLLAQIPNWSVSWHIMVSGNAFHTQQQITNLHLTILLKPVQYENRNLCSWCVLFWSWCCFHFCWSVWKIIVFFFPWVTKLLFHKQQYFWKVARRLNFHALHDLSFKLFDNLKINIANLSLLVKFMLVIQGFS